VLTAALIMALIIGCIAPLDEANTSVDKKPVKEGKTLVRLNLGTAKSNARVTALPDTSGLDAPEDFAFFKLNVTVHGSGDPVDIGDFYNVFIELDDVFDSGTWDFTVELDDGTYDFELIAYLEDTGNPGDPVANPSAWGHVTNKTLSGGDDNVDITLHEICDDYNDGVYKGSLALTGAAYNSGTLVAFSGGGNVFSGRGSLNPGKYLLTLTFTALGCETGYVKEVVYIYSGFETSYNVVAPVLRRNLFEVRFDTGTQSATNSLQNSVLTGGVPYGSVILTAVGNFFSASSNKPPSANSAEQFKEWKYIDTVGGTEGAVVKSYEKVLKDIVLLATWEPKTTTITDLGSVVLVWGDVTGLTPDITDDGTHYYATGGAVTNGPLLDIKFSATGGSTYSWTHNNVVFSTSDTVNFKFSKYDENNGGGYEEDDSWFQTGRHYIVLTTNLGSASTYYDVP